MNTGKCIVNMIKCHKGEHCLYRSFGLGVETDGIIKPSRSELQVELNRWFPGNSVQSFELKSYNNKGEFDYNISIEGV